MWNYYINEKLPKGAILTGLSAMYLHRVAQFNPAKPTIAIKHGFNSTKLSKFQFSYQTEKTINLFTEEFNGIKVYSKERLFVEFELFSMENTVASAALSKLTSICNPFEVANVYKTLIHEGRRGINSNRILSYLEDNIFDIEQLIVSNPNNIGQLLREHVISTLEKASIPVLIKGGSAIELYIPFKRATEDIDAHTGNNGIIEAFNLLINSNNGVRYEVYLDNSNDKKVKMNIESINELVNRSDKLILKFSLVPVHNFHGIPELTQHNVMLTFNRTYNDEEILSIIQDYKLSKQQLKLINKKSSMLFSVDMLIAEKINALISISQNTKRTKDLLDVYMLSAENEYDINKIIKWIFKKWENKRVSMSNSEAHSFIKDNYLNEFPKIKENFIDSSKMYNIDITYDQALARYREICQQIIKQLEYKK